MPPDVVEPVTTREAARRRLADSFRAAGLDSTDADARILVTAACRIDHAALIRDPLLPLGTAAATLNQHAARRLAGEPVSRILGLREFWGLSFAIGPGVLDPRPETEGIVGAVLDAVGLRRTQPLRLLDLGTGSGALLCALLRELPLASGVAVDVGWNACRIARANSVALGVAPRAAIVRGSWDAAIDGRFDIIVSNPPYVRTGDIAGLSREVRDHDPRGALDGGADGLDAYRAIAPRLGRRLQPGGIAALECGSTQGAEVAALMRTVLAEVRVLKDLAGNDRVVVGTRA